MLAAKNNEDSLCIGNKLKLHRLTQLAVAIQNSVIVSSPMEKNQNDSICIPQN